MQSTATPNVFHSPCRSAFPSHVRQRLSSAAAFFPPSGFGNNSLIAYFSSSTNLGRCHAAPMPTNAAQGHVGAGLDDDVLLDKELAQDAGELRVEVAQVEILGKWIHEIKRMLCLMGDGEINASPYDTAWVALVEDMKGKDGPQFPSCLQWIIDNQLPDGSWGDVDRFLVHDRLINTLACVIALKAWGVCPAKCSSGLEYLRDNMEKLEEKDLELMPIGFEIAFPSILDLARKIDLDLPYDTPALQQIYAMKTLKLNRIPRDVMHEVPTTLLHSLEGIPDLDWKKLIRLRCPNGSFLFSPSSTAYGLMQTKDEGCLKYLESIVARFDGGVPNVYPVDMFEHIWAVDRLERLGIARYLEQEIKESLDYVHRYWTDDGVCWARNTNVHDVDDTAMAFRLLRLHGYDVSADVFRNFHKDGEFFCFQGQSNQAVTGMYNLNRASQVQLPGESILEEARKFTYEYLRQKQASNQLLDKWIISEDLPGEVEYALDFPWYASLPRVEARIYLEQYGGERDVWIGKTLYRMPYVNNETYLEAAKVDFNRCQAVHQEELQGLNRWLEGCRLLKLSVRREEALEAFFLAACSVFEPERSVERLAWARSAVVMQVVSFHLLCRSTHDMKRAFVVDFRNAYKRLGWTETAENPLKDALHYVIDLIALEAAGGVSSEHPKIRNHLRQAWEDWLVTLVDEGDDARGLLLARTLEICAGRFLLEESLTGNGKAHQQCSRIAHLTASICHRLHHRRLSNDAEQTEYQRTESVDSSMREILRCVVKSIGAVDGETNKTFLAIAKTFYYAAHCPPATMKTHLSLVLFEGVA